MEFQVAQLNWWAMFQMEVLVHLLPVQNWMTYNEEYMKFVLFD